MKIGRNRHRVTLQRQAATPTADAYGQPNDAWSDVGAYWAEVLDVSGKESRIAEQLQSIATHKVTIRNVGPITTADRLVWGDAKLNILSASLDPKASVYTLVCQRNESHG